MRRRSQSNCPICYALDVVGDRWTLLIIRDVLLHGKRYYKDFLRSGEGIATNVLADRLKTLTEEGFLRRQDDPENARQALYLPTDKARSLAPVLKALATWAFANGPATLRRPSDLGTPG